ncbi:hypothetical protein OSB04_017714 [Centaurea solstitialis]|uniref:Peptidase A1 domain-containing protein n=1 Tax=Centaurea solstitialis TaxID=347529 RepID=A0AA38WL01_9ASTR|nr:hypothetical protein OSB04_017714 [Centaurea solstitialis]
MKITPSSLFSHLFIFIFTTTFSHLTTASVDVIYDSAGNKLLKGVPYYILPLLRGTGGGLTLSGNTNTNTCPLSVTQEPFELSYGVPFIVTPIFFDEDFIRQSYPVSIEADISVDPCHGPKAWKVATTGGGGVTIGGVSNTPESCFQVVEDDVMPGLRSYQIQHCPFKCGKNSTTSVSCYNVGLVSGAGGGQNVVAPTDVIFPVVFANSFGTPIRSSPSFIPIGFPWLHRLLIATPWRTNPGCKRVETTHELPGIDSVKIKVDSKLIESRSSSSYSSTLTSRAQMKLTFFCLNLVILATGNVHFFTVAGIIYDTSGNHLHTGIPYYILPLLHGSGGGLTLSGNTTDASPIINPKITQEPFEINGGIPFTFTPIVLHETLIRTSYPISIESVNPCSRSKSNIWKVSTARRIKGDKLGFQIVTTGGEMNTPESCFQVVEVEMVPELRSYQIQYCPFKCGSGRIYRNCYGVGVKLGAGGERFVGPSDAIFPVVFVDSIGKQTRSEMCMKR